MQFVALLVVASTFALSRGTPVAPSTDSGEVTTPNPFLAAKVTACRRLSATRPNSVCTDIVTYEVPAAIAAIADVIEYEIMGAVMDAQQAQLQESCGPGLRKALCKYRFPECQGTNVVMNSIDDCENLISGCRPGSVQGLQVCEPNGAVVALDSCAVVTDYPAWSKLEHCSVVDSSTQVTAWMMEYMRFTDAELALRYDPTSRFSSLGIRPTCHANTSLYYCLFYGQCVDSSTIQLRNSRDFCNQGVLDCYPHMTADSLRTTINCDLWPNGTAPVVSPPKVMPPSKISATSSSSSRPMQATWPKPFMFGNGVSLHHCVTGMISMLALFSSVFWL